MARGRRGSLTRRVGSRSPKKRVVVVCEGAKTEPSYLRLIHRRARGALIELVVVDEAATSPKQLVERACAVLAESKREVRRTRDPNAAVDEVWCVFDVDQHLHLPEAREQAAANGVQVAISNPSIELWFLLHFRDQTGHIDRRESLRQLRSFIEDYDKRLPMLDPLEGRYGDACSRAQQLTVKHEGDGTRFPADNPSSGVWALVESLQAQY